MTTMKRIPAAAWSGKTSAYPRDSGLIELFEAQVEADPDAVAIRCGATRVSYEELDQRACQLAHALVAMGVGEESPVGVYMGQRIEQIVAQVAICKLGATYVPIDPEYPRERRELMLADAGAVALITDRLTSEGPLTGGRPAICVDRDALGIAGLPTEFTGVRGGALRRTHILYTSGSTGQPKGIEIVARAICRLVLATDYVKIEAHDRVAQVANFSFDAAIFEVWGALLNGASLVLLPRSTILDPPVFRAALVESRVSVMFLTTTLFDLVAETCPDAFAGLNYLLVGGERLHAQTLRAVLECAPPRQLVNGYGPTENTTFTVAGAIELADLADGTVPLGRPICNTQVYILGSDLRPVEVGATGELFAGGDGLARGYLNHPQLTAERFLMVDGLDPDGPVRLYRTGDLARWRADGVIEFLGRVDYQVKIRGHRIEIEEVEAALLASEMLAGAAVVVQEGAHGEKSLAAHVVPRDPPTFAPALLLAHLQSRLPPYMIPARTQVIESLPVTANGKLDRQALAIVAERPAPRAAQGHAQALRDPVVAEVTAIWTRLLGVPDLTLEDDFFALGGDSLLAARLVLRVREVFQVNFPVYSLYESRTLRGFIEVVRRAQRGSHSLRIAEDGPETWRSDARLPDEIQYAPVLEARDLPVVALDVARRIFLTGATGFLGAFLLRDLLINTHAQVSCLVRARSEAEGFARIRGALRKHGLWDDRFASRIEAMPGDLSEPRLGLSSRAWAFLADNVDVIFHNGAQVNYVQPYSAHRATNVGGTTEVLRLAGRGRIKPLHHVSSIAVFGPSGFFTKQQRIAEDEPLDDHLDVLRYDIGYSASKWVAEKLVWEAARRGLPVNVYRPGFIMGHSRTGDGNADDFMGRSIKGCIQLGACPDLPNQRKEFVPVDYVSGAILRIAQDTGMTGKAYHLVPPVAADSLDLNDFFALLGECGYPLEVLSYADWVHRLIHDPQVEKNALCPLIPMLFERVYRDVATRWELYEDMPSFDASNAVAAIGRGGVPFHKMDRALLERYLEHWRQTGYLPRMEVQAVGA
jgi:amino acid adenylation domain-containing protein/thioester reductase-like protein